MTTANLFHLGGENGEPGGLGILVPLGVSFFTFRLISYVLDVYREKIEPTRDFVAFANYIAFFPCLLAGPIDRPSGFLQQIQRPRKLRFDSVANGTRQVLWGMLKKVVIADNLAAFVDGIWRNKLDYPSVVLFLCAGLYAFQMYTDFSGYSDMAIGVSKILGIQVSPNFRYPFFALNISDYWRRWHISLTSWLTDYVFLPLNVQFRNWGKVGLSIAIVLDLVLVGTWHGANWTYVLFGLYHGLLFLPLIVSGAFFKKTSLETGFWGLPKFKSAIRMLITFSLVSIGLILFRAPNIELAGKYLVGLASLRSTFSEGLDKWNVLTKVELRIGLLFVILLTIIEWYQRDREYGLDLDTTKIPVVWRWGIYYLAVIVLVLFGSSGKSGFIYAQF